MDQKPKRSNLETEAHHGIKNIISMSNMASNQKGSHETERILF